MSAKRPTVPAPGSDAAVAAGCTCPVLDNAHGRGMHDPAPGAAAWWVSADCPIHGDTRPRRITPPPEAA